MVPHMITIMVTDDITNRRGALSPGDHNVRPLGGLTFGRTAQGTSFVTSTVPYLSSSSNLAASVMVPFALPGISRGSSPVISPFSSVVAPASPTGKKLNVLLMHN